MQREPAIKAMYTHSWLVVAIAHADPQNLVLAHRGGRNPDPVA